MLTGGETPITIRITALAFWLFPDWENAEVLGFVGNCLDLIQYYQDHPELFEHLPWYKNLETAAILKMLLVEGTARGIVPDTRV